MWLFILQYDFKFHNCNFVIVTFFVIVNLYLAVVILYIQTVTVMTLVLPVVPLYHTTWLVLFYFKVNFTITLFTQLQPAMAGLQKSLGCEMTDCQMLYVSPEMPDSTYGSILKLITHWHTISRMCHVFLTCLLLYLAIVCYTHTHTHTGD